MSTTVQAPHAVRDGEKVAAMTAALRSGRVLPPVVVEPNGIVAITGSHRIAAWREAEMDADVLVMSDEDYRAACEYLGVEYLDEATDPEEMCRAVYETTESAEIRAALEDQC